MYSHQFPFGTSPPSKDQIEYHIESPTGGAIVRYLERTLVTGDYPTTNYKPIRGRIIVIDDQSRYLSLGQEIQASENEMIAVLFDPGHTFISQLTAESYPGYLIIGDTYKALLGTQPSWLSTLPFSSLQAERVTETLITDGRLELQHLGQILPFIELLVNHNSCASCATLFYQWLRAEDLILKDGFEGIIEKTFSSDSVDSAMHDLTKTIRSSGQPRSSFSTDAFASIEHKLQPLLGTLSTFLPRVGYVQDLFFYTLDQLFSTVTTNFRRLLALARAKNEFELAFFTEMSRQATQVKVNPAIDSSGLLHGAARDLALTSAPIGSIAFSVGTVHQIVADIIDTIKNLLWHAYHGANGMLHWLVDNYAAQKGLRLSPQMQELISLGFNIKELPNRVFNLLRSFMQLLPKLLDDFITNAKNYGKQAATLVSKGIIQLGSKTIKLIKDAYAKQSDLVGRLMFTIRQWFNMGRLLGPLLVDIFLFACSGGATGIFSALVKIGRVGNMGKHFRFIQKSTSAINSLGNSRIISSIIPTKVKEAAQWLLLQLRAISGSITDWLKTILELVKHTAKKQGHPLPSSTVDQFAQQLDKWYNVAGNVNAFAALFFLVLGKDKSRIDYQGHVNLVI